MGNCYGAGTVPYGSSYPYGAGPGSYRSYAYGSGYPPIIDADPITPGIQSASGVYTTLGPPRIAGGVMPPVGVVPPMGPIGATTTTYQQGFGISPGSGVTVGVPPMQTYGINPNSGVAVGVPPIAMTPVPPMAMGYSTTTPYISPQMGGVMGAPYGTAYGGPMGVPAVGVAPVGVAPIGGVATNYTTTTTTAYGAPGIGGGFAPGMGGPYIQPGMGVGMGYNRGYDLDPISPGIQTQPGVLAATGPSMRF